MFQVEKKEKRNVSFMLDGIEALGVKKYKPAKT